MNPWLTISRARRARHPNHLDALAQIETEAAVRATTWRDRQEHERLAQEFRRLAEQVRP